MLLQAKICICNKQKCLLTRDNVFGTIGDDASRRDISINALYYDITDNTIHDFTHGLDDIKIVSSMSSAIRRLDLKRPGKVTASRSFRNELGFQ